MVPWNKWVATFQATLLVLQKVVVKGKSRNKMQIFYCTILTGWHTSYNHFRLSLDCNFFCNKALRQYFIMIFVYTHWIKDTCISIHNLHSFASDLQFPNWMTVIIIKNNHGVTRKRRKEIKACCWHYKNKRKTKFVQVNNIWVNYIPTYKYLVVVSSSGS